jgi:hypothetical protein
VRRRSILAAIAALSLLLTVSMSAVSAAGQRAGVFRLALTGAAEATPTCAPPVQCGDPDAAAAMILIVIPARDTVCFLTKWWNIDGTVVAAHIHLAPAGVPGGVVVPLFAGSFDGTDKTRDCVSANGLASAILANPSAYYVNIHSTVYPPGAVRAQLG